MLGTAVFFPLPSFFLDMLLLAADSLPKNPASSGLSELAFKQDFDAQVRSAVYCKRANGLGFSGPHDGHHGVYSPALVCELDARPEQRGISP